jgi:hypothetical protein
MRSCYAKISKPVEGEITPRAKLRKEKYVCSRK